MEDSRRNYRKSLGIFELVSLGLFIVPGIAAAVSGPSSINSIVHLPLQRKEFR
jgi:hypothetical protein